MIICLKKCESEVGYGSLRKGMGNVLSQAVFGYIYKLVLSKMTEIVSKLHPIAIFDKNVAIIDIMCTN